MIHAILEIFLALSIGAILAYLNTQWFSRLKSKKKPKPKIEEHWKLFRCTGCKAYHTSIDGRRDGYFCPDCGAYMALTNQGTDLK